MARYIDPFPQYINSSGSPIVGGFLKFFDTQTSTPKNVFSDSNFATSIGPDIRLDNFGRIPTIFLNGAYRVTLTDADGNQLDDADPIGVDTDITAFGQWLVTNTYNKGDLVTGSDDLYYQSMVDSNLGNDPTSTTAFREQVLFHSLWKTQETYIQGELAIASDGRTYQSKVGANQGNDPTATTGFWELLLQSNEILSTTGIDINKTGAGSAALRYLVDSVQRWQWLFDTDESIKLNLYNASGVFDTTVISVDQALGNLTFNGSVTMTEGAIVTDGNFLVTRDGDAANAQLALTSDAPSSNQFLFQNVGITRWSIDHTGANAFRIVRHNASGAILGTPIVITETNDNVEFAENITFPNTGQGFEVTSANGGSMDFNFTNVDTDNTAFEFFDNTTTTGQRLFNIYQGNGTATITFQIDAETGTIFPSFDRAGTGEQGVKLGKITLSTAAPSGGEDGDLWLRY